MAENRFDDLEERVRRLEASVNGLTDELVETKERLRALEDEVERDEQSGIIEGQTATGGVGGTGPAGETGGTVGSDTSGEPGPDAGPESGQAAGAAEPADGDKGGADQGDDNVDSGSSDDIIVA